MMPLYLAFAHTLTALERVTDNTNIWHQRRLDVLDELLALMPHGSGFDVEVKLARPDDDRFDDRMAFYGSYHKMDEHGGYDGWVDYEIIVTPSFIGGFDMHLKTDSDEDHDEHGDFIQDTFADALRQEVNLDSLMASVSAEPVS